jgi:hypothetical protein
VRLTINGRTHEFAPEQLVNAVQMSTDYTRKSQQLADHQRQVQERSAAIERLLPVLVPEIERQIQALDAQLGKQPDWQRLAAEDPGEYQRQDALWKHAMAERDRLAGLTQMQRQETEQAHQKRLMEGHQRLAKSLPGWEDNATRGKLQSEMIKWGRSNGFPDQELHNISEPRYIEAIFKALAFDRMMGNVNTGTPIPPHVRNGTPPRPPAIGRVKDAEQRFDQTGSLRDAQALFHLRRQNQR